MKFSVLFHKFSVLVGIISVSFYSLFSRIIYFFYPNLKLGKGCIFVGFSYIRNYPGGTISIGNSCRFLSTYKSNLLGLHHKCIIATLTSVAEITIGNNSGFSGTSISAFKKVIIEDNVRCGANTLITDSDWHNDDPRVGEPDAVRICKNVWLGEGVKILKGVTIGENTVIGAGSIVTKSIPANVYAAGNPCNIIKEIPNEIISKL